MPLPSLGWRILRHDRAPAATHTERKRSVKQCGRCPVVDQEKGRGRERGHTVPEDRTTGDPKARYAISKYVSVPTQDAGLVLVLVLGQDADFRFMAGRQTKCLRFGQSLQGDADDDDDDDEFCGLLLKEQQEEGLRRKEQQEEGLRRKEQQEEGLRRKEQQEEGLRRKEQQEEGLRRKEQQWGEYLKEETA
ncbi:protein split ends-like [Drosophila pseudoobscura]|uniref:Protein split ends-like n=1 Tax=Drosophila pseudoobscura pseudoobscura TaxID=46245 RepID=A0A6I8W8V5_DROPS|nr:protein split ends-like [Drosophila pseudoobscura]